MEAAADRRKGETVMANKISDETIEYVGILAKLELSDTEKDGCEADMEKMLDYIDTLNELEHQGSSRCPMYFQ